jgi:hypothetical protein
MRTNVTCSIATLNRRTSCLLTLAPATVGSYWRTSELRKPIGRPWITYVDERSCLQRPKGRSPRRRPLPPPRRPPRFLHRPAVPAPRPAPARPSPDWNLRKAVVLSEDEMPCRSEHIGLRDRPASCRLAVPALRRRPTPRSCWLLLFHAFRWRRSARPAAHDKCGITSAASRSICSRSSVTLPPTGFSRTICAPASITSPIPRTTSSGVPETGTSSIPGMSP